MADVKTWERFTEDWNKTLAKNPAIKYFKHSEAKTQTGQFNGISPKAADLKIFTLAEVIDQHIDPKNQHYGILTGMKPEVLKILLKRTPASARQIRSVLKITTPYDFCFHSVIGLILARQSFTVQSKQVVDFILDSNSSFGDCAKMYREFKTKMPSEMVAIAGSISDGNDKELAPLQAADLLVGQVSANLRAGKPEKPFQLINRNGTRVLLAPLRWGEDAVLSGFAGMIETFNVTWASLMLEKARAGKPKK